MQPVAAQKYATLTVETRRQPVEIMRVNGSPILTSNGTESDWDSDSDSSPAQETSSVGQHPKIRRSSHISNLEIARIRASVFAQHRDESKSCE